MEQPSRFIVRRKEEKIYRLKKTLYVTSLIVSLYADDLLIIENSKGLVNEFKQKMENMFEMLDLREMRYFFGMEI
ncbi:Integrase, catalytic core [Gossypium australe]|uniref:Integrase, catalytic core n=1 Tax=Gossypium australe TaxID=47621 RepID=A0A5B6WK81_9ROSI|nr:Integrase, catalytic core [Gossypium australe]